eukprot:9463284-Alexandrium_andersonii.AAC.1
MQDHAAQPQAGQPQAAQPQQPVQPMLAQAAQPQAAQCGGQAPTVVGPPSEGGQAGLRQRLDLN